MAAFASASSDDLGRLLPITFALVCFLSLAFLRSLRLTSILIFTGIVAASATMGLASFIGMTINNATSIAPMVVFVLVISVSMHTIMRFKSFNPNPGDTIEQARRAIEQTVTPLNISVATSVISLLSLVLVDSPPIKELGFLSAIGLVIGYILTITVVPVLLTFSGAGKRPGIFDHPNRSTIISKIIPSFTKGRLSILLLAALLLLSGGVLRIDIDDDFVEYFDDSVSFRTQTELATQLLTGPNHIEVILTADSGSTVFDPKFLEYTAILTERIRLFPKIRNAFSFSDVTFQVGRALQLDHPLSGLSESDIHQIFLAYELSLKQGQSNTDLISLDHKSARISLLLDKTSSRDVQDLEEAIKLTHRSLGSPYAISITGENIPVAHLSQINIRSMVKGLAIAGLLIGAITAIKLRSLPSGVLACIAVALPIFAGFGLWGFLKGDIGISATAILALTMGIVVDDNVHFLHNFFQAMRESSRNITESVVESMSRSFPAILATSTILGAGLAVLSLSHFEVNRSFGLVTSVIVLLALLTTRGILPYLTISYFHALPSRSRSTATKFDR